MADWGIFLIGLLVTAIVAAAVIAIGFSEKGPQDP
jgi:hypothetical protein